MVVLKTLLYIVCALLLMVLVCVILVGAIFALIQEIKDMIEWSEIQK